MCSETRTIGLLETMGSILSPLTSRRSDWGALEIGSSSLKMLTMVQMVPTTTLNSCLTGRAKESAPTQMHATTCLRTSKPTRSKRFACLPMICIPMASWIVTVCATTIQTATAFAMKLTIATEFTTSAETAEEVKPRAARMPWHATTMQRLLVTTEDACTSTLAAIAEAMACRDVRTTSRATLTQMQRATAAGA